MELGYGEVERLLAQLHGVPEDRRGTLRSRIQQLQRSGFPALPALGRGGRATYSTDAVFQLVVALELTALGWPAQSTIRLVTRFWPQFRDLVDEGLAAEAAHRDPAARYAVIIPDALAPVRGVDGEARVETVSGETIAQWVLRVGGAAAHGYLVLDVAAVARRAAALLKAP